MKTAVHFSELEQTGYYWMYTRRRYGRSWFPHLARVVVHDQVQVKYLNEWLTPWELMRRFGSLRFTGPIMPPDQMIHGRKVDVPWC